VGWGVVCPCIHASMHGWPLADGSLCNGCDKVIGKQSALWNWLASTSEGPPAAVLRVPGQVGVGAVGVGRKWPGSVSRGDVEDRRGWAVV
jgi:hypothetical protein